MPFATKAIRDRARRSIAQRVRAGEPCCFCHQPIDLDIAWPDLGASSSITRSPPATAAPTTTTSYAQPTSTATNAAATNPTGPSARIAARSDDRP